jgi:hypothetical protein
MSAQTFEAQPDWVCGGCGDVIGGEGALRDHQEWCLGNANANRRLMAEVARREGGVTQEALVAAAEHYRLAQEGASPYG